MREYMDCFESVPEDRRVCRDVFTAAALCATSSFGDSEASNKVCNKFDPFGVATKSLSKDGLDFTI